MPANSKTHLRDIGEFGLIDAIARLARGARDVIKGVGDDCAVFEAPKGKAMLFTADMLAEDVHFTRSMGAKAIGYKSMASSVSDIAAMGGWPTAAVVSLGVPPNLKIEFAKNLYRGMNVLARRFNFSIVGGDTIATKKIVINVALLGTAAKEEIVYRSGAKKGDYIFVTGPLGRSFQAGKHLTFTPRLKEAQYLIKNSKPTAMIDISDGLSGDLGHILGESNVGAVLYEKLVPKTKSATLDEALSDGEDFELVFTLTPSEGRRLIKTKNKYPFYFIGEIVDGKEGFTLIDVKGKRKSIRQKGFRHF